MQISVAFFLILTASIGHLTNCHSCLKYFLRGKICASHHYSLLSQMNYELERRKYMLMLKLELQSFSISDFPLFNLELVASLQANPSR